MRRAAKKIVLRWEHRCISPAYDRWAEHVAEEKKMRRAAVRVVRKWTSLCLSRGFAGWNSHAGAQRRLALAADRIVRRWCNLSAHWAMSKWVYIVDEWHRRLRSSLGKVARQDVTCAFRSWLKECTRIVSVRAFTQRQTRERRWRRLGSSVAKWWCYIRRAAALRRCCPFSSGLSIFNDLFNALFNALQRSPLGLLRVNPGPDKLSETLHLLNPKP